MTRAYIIPMGVFGTVNQIIPVGYPENTFRLDLDNGRSVLVSDDLIVADVIEFPRKREDLAPCA